MRVLVTGNLGYIGTVLTESLVNNGHEVTGLDSGFFADCILSPIRNPIKTKNIDVRNIVSKDLEDFEVVVHLAGLSNDPVGELNKQLTIDINYKATVNLAKLAKQSGVKIFIFFSTQSIYGISNSNEELDEYSSNKNPQTEYAKTKWLAEQELKKLEGSNFSIVYVRPSTVFGWSPRLRSDIVFNNLLFNAIRYNQIKVHSDGTPWRPAIHIQDLSSLVNLILNSPKAKIAGKVFNAGTYNGNFTVKQLAEAAQKCLPEQVPISLNTEKIVDPRSYKVSFARAKNELGFVASTGLEEGGYEVINKIRESRFDYDKIYQYTTRLEYLNHLINTGRLNDDLYFN